MACDGLRQPTVEKSVTETRVLRTAHQQHGLTHVAHRNEVEQTTTHRYIENIKIFQQIFNLYYLKMLKVDKI